MKKRNTWLPAVLITAGLLAGCGTGVSGSGTDAQKTEDTKVEENDDSKGATAEERTEVRREKYDDCDGSGHGYVEIYYSDGSMETEEY